MKTKLHLTVLLSLNFYLLSSQVPQGFNYQGIARGTDGKELINTSLQVKISILSDTTGFYISGAGTYLWEEQQSITTNGIGLFNLVIGNLSATRIQGSAATFSAIDWTAIPLFAGIKIYYSGSWKNMGTAKLLTVPYSMVSGNLSGPLKKLSVTGTTSVMDEPLFEVKNKNGQTVFAVYNEGVRVYVDDGVAKGTKGGFAVGGFGTDKAVSKSYFVVSADSIRAYIAPNTAKGTKGGFAIGGFDPAKTAKGEEYLRVTRDSTRIYVDDGAAKGTKGGFAIGGFSATKGTTDNFMHLTPQNYFIGHNSGKHITTGLYNSFLGYMTGYMNTIGSSNTFFGDSTGLNNTIGSWNVFMGKEAGYSNIKSISNVYIGNGAGKMAVHTVKSDASYNVAIGTLAGYYNNGSANCFVGQEAGFTNKGGRWNVFLGTQSGYLNDTANFNVFLGSRAGFNNMGNANVFIGNYAGYNNLGANYNVFVGSNAGTSTTTGEKNVILGSDAGYSNSSGTYNTFIGNLTGSLNTIGRYNLFAGSEAGYSNVSGYYNTYLGNLAGTNATGSNNVMIGNAAGAYEYGSNKLVIDNTSSITPSSSSLIYGDFSADQLRFNAYVGINSVPSATYRLYIAGSAYSTVGFYYPSDIRLKKNIRSMEGDSVIDKVRSLSIIKYNYTDEITKGDTLQEMRYIGVVAQDVEKSFPEAVSTDDKGYKAVSLNALTAILFQAVKDQQKQIESAKLENQQLKSDLDELKTLVNTLIASQTTQGNK